MCQTYIYKRLSWLLVELVRKAASYMIHSLYKNNRSVLIDVPSLWIWRARRSCTFALRRQLRDRSRLSFPHKTTDTIIFLFRFILYILHNIFIILWTVLMANPLCLKYARFTDAYKIQFMAHALWVDPSERRLKSRAQVPGELNERLLIHVFYFYIFFIYFLFKQERGCAEDVDVVGAARTARSRYQCTCTTWTAITFRNGSSCLSRLSLTLPIRFSKNRIHSVFSSQLNNIIKSLSNMCVFIFIIYV